MPPSPSKQKKRSREKATHYALGAPIRTEILTILNDGPASHSELAKLTGLNVSRIGHHIQELLKSGSIELAAIVPARNQPVHVYRAVERARIGDDEAEQAPSEENNEVAAFIAQGFTAEMLCSLWAGKLDANQGPVMMGWESLRVDRQTWEKIHQEQLESAERVKELACEGANSLAESGEEGVSVIVASFGFERSRKPRTPYPLEVKAD